MGTRGFGPGLDGLRPGHQGPELSLNGARFGLNGLMLGRWRLGPGFNAPETRVLKTRELALGLRVQT